MSPLQAKKGDEPLIKAGSGQKEEEDSDGINIFTQFFRWSFWSSKNFKKIKVNVDFSEISLALSVKSFKIKFSLMLTLFQ